MSDKYTLITGGANGLGVSLAKLFAKDGHNILLVGRNIDDLNNSKMLLREYGIKVKTLKLDLSEDNFMEKLIEFVEKENIDVDNLINNAGIGSYGEFHNNNLNKEIELINVNIKAVAILTHYFLNKFINENKGGILNVSSTAAFCAGPKMSNYYASKSYVVTLTEGIYEEVIQYKDINISILCPGPFNTKFQQKSGIKKSESAKKCIMSVDDVARIGYRGFKKGKLFIIPGFHNRLLVVINNILPRFISRKVVKKTNL